LVSCLISSQANANEVLESHYEAKTHMLGLKCANSNTVSTRSRLAVLNIQKKDNLDYALVSGHGLPLKRPCIVHDFNGNKRTVEKIGYSSKFRAATQDDWAIISFKPLPTKDLIRYPLVPISSQLEELGRAKVSFAKARGLPSNNQTCDLISTNLYESENIFAFHNCRSIPGQSGSPLTYKANNQDYLVGLHLGKAWFLQSPETGRPDTLGYLSVFNQDMVKEIQTIIAERSPT
jgi:hypothetical protein